MRNKIYRISDTHKGKGNKASYVRVYAENKGLIAEVELNQYLPLDYIKSHKKSKYRADLKRQCINAGMPGDLFEEIFSGQRF